MLFSLVCLLFRRGEFELAVFLCIALSAAVILLSLDMRDFSVYLAVGTVHDPIDGISDLGCVSCL